MVVMCNHERLECPNHEGSFDCHSFCSTCEGNQEYCPSGCEMQYDEESGDIVYINTKCTCDQLDDDLIEDGWTCHNCYTYRKDNNE